MTTRYFSLAESRAEHHFSVASAFVTTECDGDFVGETVISRTMLSRKRTGRFNNGNGEHGSLAAKHRATNYCLFFLAFVTAERDGDLGRETMLFRTGACSRAGMNEFSSLRLGDFARDHSCGNAG